MCKHDPLNKTVFVVGDFYLKLKKLLLFSTVLLLLPFFACSMASFFPGQDRAQFLNDRIREITGADLLNVPGFIAPAGLTGYGQVVAVADSGLDKGSVDDIHPDLVGDTGKKPRIIMLKSWAGRLAVDDPVGHGTHMAGTIVGNGSSSGGKFKGVAPDASIYFQGILDNDGRIVPPTDVEKLFLPAYQANARVHVNAWGTGGNKYVESAAKTDAFVRAYPDFLVIFGAGNSGPGTKSLTSEANSKNALVVGASVSPRPALDFSPAGTMDRAQFSSRGPSGDGRIKPDLLAPGTSIVSTRSSLVSGNMPGYPLYTRMQGTSMAAAVAAGSAALLRQFMQSEMVIADPLAASVKATLINGARTTETGPSQDGFGLLDLAGTVLALKERTMFLTEEKLGLPEGFANTYKYKVEESGSPLKITVAWTDPAGGVASPKTLVNNLDLTVIAPDGRKYLGNDFLNQGSDMLNNVEQVYIRNPLPGEYTIEVRAVSVTESAVIGRAVPQQDYSLAYGQMLSTGIVKEIAPGGSMLLYDGGQVNPNGKKTSYMLNGRITPVYKPEAGYRVYYNQRSVYGVGRLWSPESVQAREGIGGRIWYEVDRDTTEGGYYQNPEVGKGLMVNGQYREDISGLPPGIGVQANLDGPTQTLWGLTTGFITERGNVVGIGRTDEGDVSWIRLFNKPDEYRLNSRTSFIYNDTYEHTDPVEIVFGYGDLNGLDRIMPGQRVTLVISPFSKTVSSVLVERSLISGYVTGINSAEERISIDGTALNVFAGATIHKDRAHVSLKKIEPGNYVTAVILPGTKEVLGMAAYSNVVYGQVLFSSAKEKSIYMNDMYNRFQMYKLSPNTEVRRWGLITDASTLSPGTWIRAVLSPDGSGGVWRLDVAELLEDEQKKLAAVDGHYLITEEGDRFWLSGATAITKEGLPVTAGDLMPGEKITVVSLLAPAPYRKVPVIVRAREVEGAQKPVLVAGVREEDGRFLLTGQTSGDRLYIWHENGTREEIAVIRGQGYFTIPLIFLDNEAGVRIVAVNRESGAVSGKTIKRSEVTDRRFIDITSHWAEEIIKDIAANGIMAGYGDGTFRPDTPISEIEITMIGATVAGVKGFKPAIGLDGKVSRASFMVALMESFRDEEKTPTGYKVPFKDCTNVAIKEMDAIAWGYYNGIIKGRSSQAFHPDELLTRSEAAAIVRQSLNYLSKK